MIKKECSCCMRYHCEYKDNYNLCSRNNKRINAKQGTTTNVERVQFTDTTLSLDTSNQHIIEGTGWNDDLTGTSGDDFFDSKD